MATFGHTDQEASTATCIDRIVSGSGNAFKPATSGVLDSITAYVADSRGGAATKKSRALIYRKSDEALIGESDEKLGAQGTGWITYTFSTKPNIVAGIEYRLCIWANNVWSGIFYAHHGGGSGRLSWDAETYNGAPDPFVESWGTANTDVSIYGSYTEISDAPTRRLYYPL